MAARLDIYPSVDPVRAPRREAPPADPHAGVSVHADYRDDLHLACDVVVVGSGPGGAVVAKELAEAGHDVILLEEGPPFGAKDFRQEPAETMHRIFREAGMRAARGNLYLPTMQAIALGGGSLINSAISCRAPDWVFDDWAERSGVESLTGAALAPHYARVERFLGIEPTAAEVLGMRNVLFQRGCEALGIRAEPTPRNVRACRGSGECFSGCKHSAKQSTDVSYVPAAIRNGARVLTSVRVERVHTIGRRATGVSGRVVAPFTGASSHEVTVEAKVVVLAAGCLATPLVLQRSDLALPGAHVGEHLQFHPGLAIMGLFPFDVRPWEGATQGYHSLEYLREGIKLEVLWAPPAVLAARLPGLGFDFQRHLTAYRRMAPFDVFVAADHSRGRVRARRGSWNPDLSFDLAARDVETLQRGLNLLSDICWAAGAEAILPGLYGVPELIGTREEASVLRTKRLRARDMIAASNHAFGTTRIARRPRDGVVDEEGRVHGVENLFVSDTGVFPGSPAVNPMLTCMALADRFASGIARSL